MEEVQVDINKNEVMIKGIVEPQTLCTRLQKKTKRRAKVMSPPPTPEGDAVQPQIVSSQVLLTSLDNISFSICSFTPYSFLQLTLTQGFR